MFNIQALKPVANATTHRLADSTLEFSCPFIVEMSRNGPLKKRAMEKDTQTPTILSRLWDLIKDQWFLIVLTMLVIFSSQVQVPGDQQGLKTRIVQNLTVAVIFFTNGLATQTRDLMANIRHWSCHVFIQAMGFFFTSLTMLGIVMAIASNRSLLDPLLLNGLVILGCLPTA